MPEKNPCSVTTRHLSHLVQRYMGEIGKKVRLQPKLILNMWPEIVGPQIATMTKAVRFENGVLFVLVRNSTLLSLLHRKEDLERLLHAYRMRVPGVELTNINFRLG